MKKLLAILALSLAMTGFATAQSDPIPETSLDAAVFAWTHSDDRAFAFSWANPTASVPMQTEIDARNADNNLELPKSYTSFVFVNVMPIVDVYSEPIDPTSMSVLAADSLAGFGEKTDGDPSWTVDPIFSGTYSRTGGPNTIIIEKFDSDGMDNVGVARTSGQATAEGYLRAWTLTLGGADTTAGFDTSATSAWGMAVAIADYDRENNPDDLPLASGPE